MRTFSAEGLEQFDYVIVGAGLFGIVCAERLSSLGRKKCLIVERRNTIGGNCAATIDPETGIEIHTYGSHIFHTKNERVWNYVSQFTAFNSYHHHVWARHDGELYPMPMGLSLINKFFKTSMTPLEAKSFIHDSVSREGVTEPENLEQQAISLIGGDLYRSFIRDYTTKQWGQAPETLPAAIIKRLPIRYTYNSEYFQDPYQGIPADGYAAWFQRMVSNPLITVVTGLDWKSVESLVPDSITVIYTGQPDELMDYRLGPLGWRSLRFETYHEAVQDVQGCAVINESDLKVPYTRTHEYKHYHPEWVSVFNTEKTVLCREYPTTYTPGGDAYYPINTSEQNALHSQYLEALSKERPNYVFGGRLGAYKYWDMDVTVLNALELTDKLLQDSCR